MTDDEPTVSVPAATLAQRTIDLALEIGEYDRLHIPDDCDEWSLKDMDVDTVEMKDESTVVVEGEVTGSVAEKVSSARYNPPSKAHPAEYESHDVPIWLRIEWDMSQFACTDEISIEGEALKDPTAPPEPDIDAHRYDEL
jgi:hypothetical protein